MTKVAFIDVDGTLLDHDHTVPPSAVVALSNARKEGHRLIFCTGRNVPEIFPELWDLGFSGLVGGGGAYGEIDGEVIFDYRVDKDLIAKTTRWFEEHGLPWVWQSPNYMYGSQTFWDAFDADSFDENVAEGRRKFLEEIRPAIREGVPEAASKAVVILPPNSPVTFDLFEERFRNEFTVVPGSMTDTFGQSVELVPEGINKATGMWEMAKHMGISPTDTVAIGDSSNDVELIAEAALGIAMGNSVPEVIEKADWVSTNVENDGLATALEHAGMLGKQPPVNLIAVIPCPAENLAQVRQLLESYGTHVLQMDGAERFEVYENSAAPELYVIERYRDDQAFAEHMADPENKVLNDKLAELTPGGSELTFLK